MRLNLKEIQDRPLWLSKGYKLPDYDINQVRKDTLATPRWIHFGAGNIFRAFPAVLQQKLLNEQLSDHGIIVCEAFDEEIIDLAYTPFDNLSLAITLNSDGKIGKEVVASVVHSIKASQSMQEVIRMFVDPALQMASFTITEKGYSVKGQDGNYLKWIEKDLDQLPENPSSLISLLTILLFERFKAGQLPIALVSMDNCSHNGTKLYDAVMTFAKSWVNKGLLSQNFIDYLDNRSLVSFPWSMIDKITPRPSDTVQNILEKDGFENTQLIVTEKSTYTASFVNAEPTEYLVIEDWFPNGRPPLEKAGVLFTDRETVEKIETMKVTTCLNPLHTVMAIFGCLLNFKTIADIGNDPVMRTFIEKVGYSEGMPVVVDPGIINPLDFIRNVIEVRFPNPYLPDAPQRIATDTSQKISVRFGETLKSYIKRGKGEEKNLKYIPLFFAGWLRYLLAVDDSGTAMALSSDPMLPMLQQNLSGIVLGKTETYTNKLLPILANESIFGVDLVKYGLSDQVIQYFSEMITGPGAVKKTLNKYIQ